MTPESIKAAIYSHFNTIYPHATAVHVEGAGKEEIWVTVSHTNDPERVFRCVVASDDDGFFHFHPDGLDFELRVPYPTEGPDGGRLIDILDILGLQEAVINAVRDNIHCGLEELRDRIDAKLRGEDEDLIEGIENDFHRVLIDNSHIYIVDVNGGLHFFRIKVERL